MADRADIDSVINVDAALAFTAGDRETLKSLASLFLEEGPLQLSTVNVEIKSGNLKGIQRAAHALKGSVTIFAAQDAIDAARQMELVAGRGETDKIPSAWKSLQNEIQRLLEAAKKLSELSSQ